LDRGYPVDLGRGGDRRLMFVIAGSGLVPLQAVAH
jgi:hypothetical protein